ncbi:RDD family protein [Enterovibrio paralichthyis]|uniref:RDD family protein n=1 Tax=Enterovibrio paralichthyis TaxID=2853805 RepID=UPI0006D0CB30|nr:RDD family protein [Enterovibrio paralichthyis]MBV7300993.1 RDD family protein [Enterovibrio paralichthyis]
MAQSSTPMSVPKGAGFFRRMGAWLYDFLVLIAVEMLAIALVVGGIAVAMQMGLSMEGYVDVGDYLTRNPAVSPFFSLFVFAVAAAFYGYFWTHGGQTVGMKAWKLKMVSEFGGDISFTQSLVRMATACLGLGNLLALFDSNNRAFQDHFAHCQVVKIEK